MDFSISTMAIDAAAIDTSSAIGLIMMKKSLDAMVTEGSSMQKMLEASVTPHLGQNIDYSV